MNNFLYGLSVWAIPLVLCMVIHELAHGYVAMKLGDKTALREGRLTLNPVAHIDPMGSIFLPLILVLSSSPVLFGWAKPVPVNFNALNKPKRDMGLVAAAGPVSNILLAIIFVFLGRIVLEFVPISSPFFMWLKDNIMNGILFSLVLAVFNLLPILPLDGGRILASLLPKKLAYQYQQTEQYGMYILLGLMILPFVLGVNLIGLFLGSILPYLYNFIMWLAF
ncbi:MAG: site-2 protease family protein [Alphaproteobacteria bacterium]|nr:site-2 protease family protein [Alphaproteobacteria bacterium]